jgi:hypothetical protein
MPSSRARRRAIIIDTRSVACRHSSMVSNQIVLDTLSPPDPSTLYGAPDPGP